MNEDNLSREMKGYASKEMKGYLPAGFAHTTKQYPGSMLITFIIPCG